MTDFATWLLDLIKALFKAGLDFLKDVFIAIVKMVLGLIGDVIAAIPTPEFTTNSLGSMFSKLDPMVLYFVSHLNLTACFGVLAAAFAFRMARKVVTLFQW